MSRQNSRLIVLAVIAAAVAIVFGAKAFDPHQSSWKEILYQIFLGVSGSAIASLFTVLILLFLQSNANKKSVKIDLQRNLYTNLIDWIKTKKNPPKKIIFIHHSGFLVNDCLDFLMRLKTEIHLYQQCAQSWTSLKLELGEFTSERIEIVPKEMHKREKNKVVLEDDLYQATLKIKRFSSPASVRAILVDEDLLIMSWYVYSKEGEGTNVKGSEYPGIMIFKGSAEFDFFHKMLQIICKDLDQECTEKGIPYEKSELISIYEAK